MRIAVFGLGYVGCVAAACLASEGHRVAGVDVNPEKVERLNRGLPTVEEPGLAARVRRTVRGRLLSATGDGVAAAREADVSLICVGTPGGPDGRPDLGAVESSARAIGEGIRGRRDHPVAIVRSTVPPGTTEARVIPALEASSGLRHGRDFGVAVNPEFLREGSSIADYERPSRVVIGSLDPKAARRIRALYRRVRAPVVVTDLRTAEMVKYADNAFHGVKVSFANEIGSLSKALGVDGRRVMEIFCMDRKLNLAPYYLRPGMPYGGSCIPKDTRALASLARGNRVATPLLEASLASNEAHKGRLVELLAGLGRQPVGLLGMAFKGGTDDFRESAALDVAAALIRRGCEVRIFDPYLDRKLAGANLQHIQGRLPGYKNLLVTPEQLLETCAVVVVLSRHGLPRDWARNLSRDQVLVDWTGRSGVTERGRRRSR